MPMNAYLYQRLRPPAPLSDSIECFWRLLMPVSPPPDEILSAEGRAEILFQFEGRSQALSPSSNTPFACTSSWIVRPYAHALRVRQVGISASAMIGVRFRPGGWAAFQRDYSTEDAADSLVVLGDFYKPLDVRLLEEQLHDALYTPQWSAPLVNYFTRCFRPPLHTDRMAYATRRLLQRDLSIAALANQVNLSERQFTRVFHQLVGLSPKQFARVSRIHRVLYSSDYTDSALTLQQIAVRHGYHDAAHLTHDFQDLVGMPPAQYFSGIHALIAQKKPQDDRFLQSE